ncbi:MAG: helix-turn-helix transcriptional regulator [Chloroflexi bacterium]|nr:helix-turn-helix transcriptional regulator [Chloroflexota bacterium]
MSKPELLQLGKNLRSLRLSTGLSQEKLAELTGLHRTYIGGVERGERNISLINLVRIARALEISVTELVKGVE